MAERELELRLKAVARALEAGAPAFDPTLLGAPRRRIRGAFVALVAAVALVGVTAAPAAVSAVGDLFGVDEVSKLDPVEPGVAPPFEGRRVPVQAIQAAPFRVRTISSLGAPDAAYVREDIAGGMVTIAYGRTLLTQWRTTDVDARIAIVPIGGTAVAVTVRRLHSPALWIEGNARGTFTLVGADGAVHREHFEVSPGALLWKEDGLAFLLRDAGAMVEAVRLAGDAAPSSR